MKSFLSIFPFLLLAVGTAQGQCADCVFHSTFESQAFSSQDPIQILLASDPDIDLTKYNAYRVDLEKLGQKLQKKIALKNVKRGIERAFYFTHRKKLSWYENYVTLSDLLEKGKYDCLTGTALYAILLDQLSIPYKIYEFDYHVLIVARPGQDSVLIESTDPIYGFLDDPEAISAHIAQYLGNGAQTTVRGTPVGAKGKDQYSSHIFNTITLHELAGLQYFNLAIDAYNHGQIVEAEAMLHKAKILYPGRRIEEIQAVFSQALASN